MSTCSLSDRKMDTNKNKSPTQRNHIPYTHAGLEIKGCPRARGTLNVLRARKNTGMRALLAPKKRPYYCIFIRS